MDFQSAMETFAEAWVAANSNSGQQTHALALTRPKSTPEESSISPTDNRESSNHSSIEISTKSPKIEIGSPSYQQQQQLIADNLNRCNSNILTNNLNVNNRNENICVQNGPEKLNSVERKENDFSKLNSKSLPLHCIVESFTSLQASFVNDFRSPWKRRSNIETDSYVIVPAVTPFCDIVSTALQRLGYSTDIANTAKGAIIIKNWKPLPLDIVSDSPLVSVGEILGELTSVVTLRIAILRSKPSTLTEIKDKLLKLLVFQSHAILRSTGCPLDEIILSQICRNPLPNTFPFTPDISEELKRKFDLWWNNQLTPQPNHLPQKMIPLVNQTQNDIDYNTAAAAVHLQQQQSVNRESLHENHHSHHQQQQQQHHHNILGHPALQTVHNQYPNQKTRMRTSFDPEMELPKLQKWFQDNPHPSRQQIQSYVIQLNSLESRRGRKPLDVNNVVYWFKNARAAQKRAEMRSHGIGNGYNNNSSGILMSHGDYIKSPLSAPSEDIDNLSQHSDFVDEDDRPVSPQVPLSLTTHERNRSPSIDTKTIKLETNRGFSPTPNNNNNIIPNEEIINNSDSNEINHQNNLSPKTSPTSEEYDMEDSDFRSPSPDSRRDMSFPSMVSNSMFSHSIMYMSHYIPGAMGHGSIPNTPTTPTGLNPAGLNLSALTSDERRKRNRTFIDPVTEVPKLEQWFSMNTHPSHNLILKYTEDLNRMPYRQKFPRLESKNVQFWFKNRRAKCKRLKMSLYDTNQLAGLNFNTSERD